MKAAPAIIWDLPTRVFHWLLVTSFALAWITFDDNRYLFAHVYAGYLFLSLLIFRFVWGVVGTYYARFRTFAYDWASGADYLKGLLSGKASRHIGHNPVGGWAIFIMLALGLLIGITGLLVLGGEEGHGPLRGLISFEIGTGSKEFHEVFAWIMLAIVVIHVFGVIGESIIHRENLIWSMLTGRKEDVLEATKVRGHGLLGVLLLTIVFASALFYFRGYLVETADDLYRPFQGPSLPDNATWRSECGDCHLAFHPTLLPKRSWQLMLNTLDDHFGEELEYDAETLAELEPFLTENAAESGLTEPAHKVNKSIAADKTPLRITKTKYWVKKHIGINDEYWDHEKIASKTNCEACHLDAEEGTFEDSDMRLPNIKK